LGGKHDGRRGERVERLERLSVPRVEEELVGRHCPDLPVAHQHCHVELLDDVRHGGTRVLHLLTTVLWDGVKDKRAICESVVSSMLPLDNAGHAVRCRACVRCQKRVV
jgi:hypothetical protein